MINWVWNNMNSRWLTFVKTAVPLVEQELLTRPEHPSSPLVFSEVRVSRSLVLCICFVDRCLSFCPFVWSVLLWFTYPEVLNIPKALSEVANRRMTDNTMVKRKRIDNGPPNTKSKTQYLSIRTHHKGSKLINSWTIIIPCSISGTRCDIV